MKAYIITIKDHVISEAASDACIMSHKQVKNDFDLEPFDAVTPPLTGDKMSQYGISWNYPWEGVHLDIQTGLRKSAYRTADPLARIACALSHYELWMKCAENGPLMVLEHDARFMHKVPYQEIIDSKFNIIGLNDPIGATRLPREFDRKVKAAEKDITPIPAIDNFDVPQGLAGNSAYIIKPAGAKALLKAVKEYGLWPNDSLMCKQIIKKMGVTKKYYTVVQGLPSTTTD